MRTSYSSLCGEQLWQTDKVVLMRWVKPEKLRPKLPDEPRYFYPASLKC
jgi:hypothetical protein